MTGKASVDQRTRIANLLKRCEFDMHRCSSFHVQIARQAGIATPEPDALVDDWLNGLSPIEATKLTYALRDRLE